MPSAVPMRGLRIDDELYNKVVFLAKQEERSFNQQAAWILKRYVAEYERQHGPIRLQPDTQQKEV